MDNIFFTRYQDQKSLKKAINFTSRLNKKELEKKQVLFSELKNNLFIKENFKQFFIPYEYEQSEQEKYLDIANLVLSNCEEYNWDNLWLNFKKMVFKENNSSKYYEYNIIFKWILLLIYLNDEQKINFNYFLCVHKNSEESFEQLGLFSEHDWKASIRFTKEISWDIDKIDTLLLKIKSFFEQLDAFFIKNFNYSIDFFNHDYKKIREEIKNNQYFFKKEYLGEILKFNDKNFVSDFTTIEGNLSLPIGYIFAKYLLDHDFLIVEKNFIKKFLEKSVNVLEIKNVSLLENSILNIFRDNSYYKEVDGKYIFIISYFEPIGNLLEDYIIKHIEDLVEDVKFSFSDSFNVY